MSWEQTPFSYGVYAPLQSPSRAQQKRNFFDVEALFIGGGLAAGDSNRHTPSRLVRRGYAKSLSSDGNDPDLESS